MSSSTSSAAWYGRWPYSSRSPVSTATSAVARAADSSSTSAERNATRSVAMAADRCCSVTAAITCSWALARPNTFSVGRPCTTSRKCPHSWASSRHWRRVCALVCRPARAAKAGISGSVTAITTPEIQSTAVTVASTAAGTSTDSTSCGRYRANQGSSPSRPRVARAAIWPGCCPPSQAGPSRRLCPVSLRRSCDLTRAAARSAAASPQ